MQPNAQEGMHRLMYTLNDLALMTMLSTRTLCTYIKKGLLQGTKRQAGWSFTETDLEHFFEEPYIKESIEIKKRALINDFVEGNNPGCACMIYDYRCENESQAQELCDKFICKINTLKGRNMRFSFAYHKKSKIGRVILQGEARVVSKLMDQCIMEE